MAVDKSGFSGENAYRHIQTQMDFGPRTPGSAAHDRLVDWLVEELRRYGWQTEIQTLQRQGHTVRNIIARRGDQRPWLLLGAHYDSRLVADRDTDLKRRATPVPGANDGASGVAVLLELARSLPEDLDRQVWLVFFDLEDQGKIAGWDWIIGSRAMAEALTDLPDAVVIVDMVGDSDQKFKLEKNSHPGLSRQIWEQAAQLGYGDRFVFESGPAILDDHIPFIELGIPSVDIIDFDYPHWHTTQDTADKVSPASLEAVGRTLEAWLQTANWQIPQGSVN